MGVPEIGSLQVRSSRQNLQAVTYNAPPSLEGALELKNALAPEEGIFEVRPPKARSLQVRFREPGALKVRSREIGSLEMR